jgi:hypothetical protein
MEINAGLRITMCRPLVLRPLLNLSRMRAENSPKEKYMKLKKVTLGTRY